MKILVIGGTGMVGSHVVRELLARNADVTVLTRSAEKIKDLPEGVAGITGDLLEIDTVTSIFDGFDGAFLINTVTPTENTEGLLAVNGARLADVGRMVYVSVQDADKAAHLPHFGAKVPIEMAIAQSGIPYTILRPNNFYQNDYWFKDALLQYGVYPQPIGNTGLSRVDVRDIAEAAAVALTTGAADGETINLIGPDVHTGQSTAEVWSQALGRSITYGGNDLEAWEQQSLQYMPPVLVFDFKHMYAFFQEYGLKASAADIERQTKLLGHTPRSFADFTRETAQQWVG